MGELSMARRKYRNPPIEEALCEFRFAPSQDWDPTVPGRFHERIRERYPAKPREQRVVEAGFQVSAQSTDSAMQLKHGLAKAQFPTADGKRLVAVGPDVMSVHVLKPYPGWHEDFRARIEQALQAYNETTVPKGITQIGLRYINQVVIPADTIELDDYFTTPPRTPDKFPERQSAIFSRIESFYTDEPIRLVFTFANVKSPEGTLGFLLDLDLVWSWGDEPLALNDAMDKVEELRHRERNAFEALITERTREVFDAEA
jgi:uncharacterized protein (TIGR04255 family)